MNDTMQKRRAPGKGAAGNGPVLAVLAFCLAYGSVMALVIAPRSLLTAGSGSDSPDLTENSLAVTGTDQVIAGQTSPQLLKAGFRPAEASSLYGITD